MKFIFLLAGSLFFVGTGSVFIWTAFLKIPDFNKFEERRVDQSTKIYDRTGEVLLFDVHKNIKRRVIPFGEISRDLKNAAVAIEDAEFYQHKGIKPSSILRAFLVNLGSVSVKQGGSTITQQVIKNALLSSERTLARKIKEALLSIKLEKALSKEEILGLYLNESPFGGSLYGVEEASQTFFGKSAKDISLAEAAYIASLPKAPTYYSPYGNHKKELDQRKNVVLARMRELGFITQQEEMAAQQENVLFRLNADSGIKAPHLVMMVRNYLEEKYGLDSLEKRGFKVITTLDWNLQRQAEATVAHFAALNDKQFDAHNASMVGLNPKTGEVLVLVGSRDYFDIKNEGSFNIALAHRQPGSAFKPFVYVSAFDKGFTPETALFDLKTQFETRCDSQGKPLSPDFQSEDCYAPVNYDGLYRGPVTIRNALAQSINIPAIKTLYLVGLSDALKTARAFGIKSLDDPERYGLTLVLGGGEVSLMDLTSAYGVFANDGVRNPYKYILKIEDSAGNLLEESKPDPSRVMPEDPVRLVTSILTDNKARAPAFGENSLLYIPEREVAAKTGTTNDYRDAWIVGYTPNFVLGAWAGNNDNSPMQKKVAGFIVAPMWNAFFKEALRSLPIEKFPKPEKKEAVPKPVLRGIWKGGETYFVDKISGKLATQYTPEETKEERVLTSIHSILYWLDRQGDPQFNLWEEPVRKWAGEQKIVEENKDFLTKEPDDIHSPDIAPKIRLSLTPDREIKRGQTLRLNVLRELGTTTPKQFPIEEVRFFLNGHYLASSRSDLSKFIFIPETSGFAKQENELRVVVYDSVRNSGEAVLSFNIAD